MNILIAAPIRNRGWILNQYLNCLYFLDTPGWNIDKGYYFILNDCTDNSREILEKRKEDLEPRDYSIHYKIDEINFNTPSDMGENGMGRSGIPRELHTYKNLSVLRNKILEYARGINFDYIFSVDSDILVKPDILEKLIATKKDIVAALVRNSGTDWNFLPLTGRDRNTIPSELFEVKVTGACYLISKNVFINKNIKYSNEFSSGEDEAFCHSAREQGFKSYVLADEQIHIIRR
jgi:hypothetical protein